MRKGPYAAGGLSGSRERFLDVLPFQARDAHVPGKSIAALPHHGALRLFILQQLPPDSHYRVDVVQDLETIDDSANERKDVQ